MWPSSENQDYLRELASLYLQSVIIEGSSLHLPAFKLWKLQTRRKFTVNFIAVTSQKMSGSLNFSVRTKPFRPAVISFYFLFLLLLNHPECKGRTYPRFSSKSFRFPSDHSSEGGEDIISASIRRKDVASEKNPRLFVSYGEARKVSLPASSLFPESSSKTNGVIKESEIEFSGESLSAEIIEVGGAEDGNMDRNTTSREDEELRKVLCPSVTLVKDESLYDRNITKPAVTGSTTAESWLDGEMANSPAVAPLRYDLQAGKCAQVGRKEHCGENMIFVAETDSGAYGYCDCDFENKIQRRTQKGNEDHTGAGATSYPRNIPLVYHPATNSCYPLYDQAYCGENEWLILSREVKGPICEERKCPLSPSPSAALSASGNNPAKNKTRQRQRASKLLSPSLGTDPIMEAPHPINNRFGNVIPQSPDSGRNLLVPLNGVGPCVELNRENSENCEEGEKVVFNVGDIVPKCGIPGRAIEGRAIVRNACPPGSFYSIIGRCQPDWDF